MRVSAAVPLPHCWVKNRQDGSYGVVVTHKVVSGEVMLLVKWRKNGISTWIPLDSIGCGFVVGMEVQDHPRSRVRKPLGEGIVLDLRVLGGREQVLVEFPDIGRRYWLPYENLTYISSVRHRFRFGRMGGSGNAERFRLRCLAYALEMWNQNTGSLSRLDIDPLPHQVHLVHYILASGNLNWLIADDVGLGKTIEVGMLMSALEKRGSLRRVLLVCPAGLTRQWQEELRYKFGMDDFLIYGIDFEINNPRHWKLHDRVIGSIDRLKMESHLERLLQADRWDLIVFDEAHRLSRHQQGCRLMASERFRLAAKLREKTDSLLLLTATPHQGREDLFQALLELLRPEWTDKIRNLRANPEILTELMIRNNKSEVTDWEGRPLFAGKITHSVEVNLDIEYEEFSSYLVRYLRRGYQAGEEARGVRGRAIGFVMTVYRKLAASSIAAIKRALERRLNRLLSEQHEMTTSIDAMEGNEIDERFYGEWEESQIGPGTEFFSGEISMLKKLLVKAASLINKDRKVKQFLHDVVEPILRRNHKERILIFTEYCATQDYLQDILEKRYGKQRVAVINGGMNQRERAVIIEGFNSPEGEVQFLISTEAGGEGINLQERCHILVNYDLPWNPMRLVQRIGRLYRYGQKKKVVVFNINSPQTLDARIMMEMYRRISTIVKDLAVIGDEFRPGLEDDILGQFTQTLDVEAILEQAIKQDINVTLEQLTNALQSAREAVKKERELFEFATVTTGEAQREDLRLDAGHIMEFVRGMCRQLDIPEVKRLYGGKVIELRLPSEVKDKLGRRSVRLRITAYRKLSRRRGDIEMMDWDNAFFQYLLEAARDYRFDGRVARLRDLQGEAIVTSVLCWQNDQGRRMREEYTVVEVDGESIRLNPPDFVDWLRTPQQDGDLAIEGDKITSSWERIWKKAITAFDNRLAQVSNLDLHPEGYRIINAGWLS